MKIATGKVVGGKVVVDGAPLEEGASVTVLAGDGERGFTLSPEEDGHRGGPKNSPRRAARSMRTIYNSWSEVLMKYRVALHKSEEGYSVSVPGLPGCESQGATENEALENIRDAVREYLTVVEEQLRGVDIREIEVAA